SGSSSPSPFQLPPTPQSYPLSLHDALPIYRIGEKFGDDHADGDRPVRRKLQRIGLQPDHRPLLRLDRALDFLDQRSEVLVHLDRSEEHTSELQSRENLVCRLLLEKKKKKHR